MIESKLELRQNVRNVKPLTSKAKVKNKETKKIETKTFEVKQLKNLNIQN